MDIENAVWVDTRGVSETLSEMSGLGLAGLACLLAQPGLQDDLGHYNSLGTPLPPAVWRELVEKEQARRLAEAPPRTRRM